MITTDYDENEELDENFEEPMHSIIEPIDGKGGLYIGDFASVLQTTILKINNIKTIISVCDVMLSFDSNEMTHLMIPALDAIKFDIYQYFEKSYKIIFEGMNHANVLVHCFRGVSRSGTILIAFLMKFWGWKYENILEFVQKKRKCISPNAGFVRQLLCYEKELLL